MKLFKRRKTTVADPTLPPEVQAYSQAEHRERMGVAWLVGSVSLVLTIFVLVGLFFGGRWLYRTIAGPSANDSQTQSTTENDQATKDKEQTKNEGTPSATPDSDQPSTTPAPAPTPTPTTPTTPSTTPTTGPTMPRTGPDSDE